MLSALVIARSALSISLSMASVIPVIILRDIIVETLGCKPTSVSISIEDINEKDWKDKVWDIDIKDNNNLIIKPGYNCED